MKSTLIALLATLLSTLPGICQETTKPEPGNPAPAETLPAARTITDLKGRAMVGVIVAKTETAITFVRASDQKKFEIALDTLSEADKAFVAGRHTPQAPASVALIPFEIKHTMWTPHYGTYALIRVEDTIFAIHAIGIDGKRSRPNDDCYYSIQYSVTKITPDRANQIITKAISHEPLEERGILNCGKFKLEWAAGGHNSYRIEPRANSKTGPPPGTEYYNQLLPTLDSITSLDPNRWVPVPVR